MSFKEAVKRSMDGLAHAHAGEMLPWEEKCRILGVENEGMVLTDREEVIPTGTPSGRTVALMVGHNLTSALMDYATYSCRCLEAGLMLLIPGSVQALEQTLRPFLPRLVEAGIVPRILRVEAGSARGLAAYLHDHRDVIFVVVGSSNEEYRAYSESEHGRARWRFPVPLVVVDEEQAHV